MAMGRRDWRVAVCVCTNCTHLSLILLRFFYCVSVVWNAFSFVFIHLTHNFNWLNTWRAHMHTRWAIKFRKIAISRLVQQSLNSQGRILRHSVYSRTTWLMRHKSQIRTSNQRTTTKYQRTHTQNEGEKSTHVETFQLNFQNEKKQRNNIIEIIKSRMVLCPVQRIFFGEEVMRRQITS